MADGLNECLNLSGVLKVVEIASVFVCIMLHRIGNRGIQIFYGATDHELNYDDNYDELSLEMLGAGSSMALAIITPLLLVSYLIDGRKKVQSTSLDVLLSLIGAGLMITVGAMTCFAWNSNRNMNNINVGRRDFEVAGSLGVMTIFTGIVYLIDFFNSIYQGALLQQSSHH